MWAVCLMIGMMIGSFLTAAMLAIVSMGRDESEELATAEAKAATVSRPPTAHAATVERRCAEGLLT